MNDVIIIGTGPAGVSLAIYLKRSGINPLMLTTHKSALFKAKSVDNYYGFSGVSGTDIYNAGIKQLIDNNISIIEEEVTDIKYDSNFSVCTNMSEYSSKSVVLATGVSMERVNIENMDKFEGKGVSYCATCDGYFFKDKKVGIIGSGDYALSEYNAIKDIVSECVLFTNGINSLVFENNKIDYIQEKILSVSGEATLNSVFLESGEEIQLDGLFIANGIAGSTSFARKLGVSIDGNRIVVDEDYKTNIPGLYAVGDTIGGFLQIATAVGEGAELSLEVKKFLKSIS